MDWLPLLAQADPELLRPYISFDFDDLAALLVAVGAIITAVRVKRSQSKTKTTQETVDADVLGQFLGLTDRVAALELEVADLKLRLAEALHELAQAKKELAEMQKVEEYLRARLHEKDKELLEVREAAAAKQAEIETLRGRVRHLELVCKRAGINGDDMEDEV